MFKLFKPHKRRADQAQISSSMPHQTYCFNQLSRVKQKTCRTNKFVFTPMSSQGARQFNSMTSRNGNKSKIINQENFFSILKKSMQDKKKIYSSQKSLRRNQSSLTKTNNIPNNHSIGNIFNSKGQTNLGFDQAHSPSSKSKISIKQWNKLLLKQNNNLSTRNNQGKSIQRILKKTNSSTLRSHHIRKAEPNRNQFQNKICTLNNHQLNVQQSIQQASKNNAQYCKIIIHIQKSQSKEVSVRYKVKKIGSLIQFLKKFIQNYYIHHHGQKKSKFQPSDVQQEDEKYEEIVSFQTIDYNLQLDYYLTLDKEDGSFLNGQTIQLRPLYSSKQAAITLNSFEIVQCIGSGGFSTVFLCRFKQNYKFYAMKVISKPFIVKNQKKKIIMNQRNIMVQLRNKMNLSKLFFSFQSKQYLVFVMQYYEGGELFNLVKRFRKMNQQTARFYITEILIGLQQIHNNNIVYRDFKPENIMIDIDGHACIADFGLAKPLEHQRAYSFCGSPQYMPPQMILKQGHGLPVDFYCIGALLYQLVTGLPPFYSTDPENIYQSTLSQQLTFPNHVSLSPQLLDLLSGLLSKDESYRIGTRYGVKQVLSHRWFESIKLEDFLDRKVRPPVNFKKIEDLRFNIDQIQEENQKQMKQILKNQKIDSTSKYLKIMNGFYYDYRLDEQQPVQQKYSEMKNFKKQKNHISIQKSKNNSSSLALTNCTKRSQGSLTQGTVINNNNSKSQNMMKFFMKNRHSQFGLRQNSLNKYKKSVPRSTKDIHNNQHQKHLTVEQRLFKNLNNFLK